MIEEAAGTSMFEEKKEKAVKTMARKEKRLDEIQGVRLPLSFPILSEANSAPRQLLDEEITPKLNKLRDEKRAFLDFQKKTSELERLTKLVVAWDWTQFEARKVKGIEGVAETEAARKQAEEGRKRMEGEIVKMEKEIGDIEARRDKVRSFFF